MTHVLIATDGSEQSLKAARYLRSLLDPVSLERVSVLAVVGPLAAYLSRATGEEEHVDRQDEDPGGHCSIGRPQEAVERRRGELRTCPTWKPSSAAAPSRQIIGRVRVEADLIVIGGRGKGRWRKACRKRTTRCCTMRLPVWSRGMGTQYNRQGSTHLVVG